MGPFIRLKLVLLEGRGKHGGPFKFQELAGFGKKLKAEVAGIGVATLNIVNGTGNTTGPCFG